MHYIQPSTKFAYCLSQCDKRKKITAPEFYYSLSLQVISSKESQLARLT